jgi:hypothetical protein
MKKVLPISLSLFLLLACNEIQPEYPDEPVVDYQGTSYYFTEDQLGNWVLTGRLSFEFTDGDGNLGLDPLPENSDTSLADTVKYNFFLQLYDLQDYEYVKIPEDKGGILKYRIPALNKNPTSGLLELDISYPLIVYDTIFYTFFIMDRDYNRSNTDTTDIQVLSGIVFPEDEEEEETP